MLSAIYEVKLDKDFGYCLVSVLDYAGHQMGASLAVQPLEHFSKEPSKFSKEELEQLDAISAPILSLVKPPSRGNDKWRKLHSFEDGREYELPICIYDATQRARYIFDWNEFEWEAIFRMNTMYAEYHKFCEVAHLTGWTIGNQMYIKVNLTMLWMHIKGEDIKLHYKTDARNSSEQFLYKKVKNIRLYKDVPKEYRNKIWTGGCAPARSSL